MNLLRSLDGIRRKLLETVEKVVLVLSQRSALANPGKYWASEEVLFAGERRCVNVCSRTDFVNVCSRIGFVNVCSRIGSVNVCSRIGFVNAVGSLAETFSMHCSRFSLVWGPSLSAKAQCRCLNVGWKSRFRPWPLLFVIPRYCCHSTIGKSKEMFQSCDRFCRRAAEAADELYRGKKVSN